MNYDKIFEFLEKVQELADELYDDGTLNPNQTIVIDYEGAKVVSDEAFKPTNKVNELSDTYTDLSQNERDMCPGAETR